MLNFHLGRRPALDGLRGVAVLLVTGYHLGLPGFDNGFLGVDVFFTLSVFLITSLLIEELLKTGRINLKFFYIRRLVRLYPALVCMLLIVGPISQAYPYVIAALSYSTNWMMALNIQPMVPEFSHTWSLAIEEQYYFIWPIVLILLARKPSLHRLILIPIIIALSSSILRILYAFAGLGFWRIYAGTDAHMDGLLLGSALGAAAFFVNGSRQTSTHRWVTWGVWVGIGLFLMASIFSASIQYTKIVVVGPLLVALISCMLIYSTTFNPSTCFVRILSSRVLVFFGTISYGLYLWQMPVIQWIKLDPGHFTPWMQWLAQFSVTLVLTLASYRFIEQPAMRLNRRLGVSRNHMELQTVPNLKGGVED